MKDENDDEDDEDHHLLSRRMSTVYDDDQLMHGAMEAIRTKNQSQGKDRRKSSDNNNKLKLEARPSHPTITQPSGSEFDRSISVDLDNILNDLANTDSDHED